MIVGLLLAFSTIGWAASRVELGGNVNENLCSLQVPLLDRSRTTWVRGMLPFAEFVSGKRDLATDKPLRALQAAAESGRKVILTLKWDLKENQWRVPARGSDAQRRWMAWLDQALDAMSGRTTILVVTNEIFVDTVRQDLEPLPSGSIPYLEFLQDVVAHVKARNLHAADGSPLPIYLGGFTRLQDSAMQGTPGVRAILNWAQASPQISGIDVHLHTRTVAEMSAALRFARSQFPTKPMIVTEFSTVWAYQEHLDDALGTGDKGRQFVQRYQLDSGMRVFDYINQALADPVPEEQWHAFLASRDWFNPRLLTEATGSMADFGVTVATYAFSEALRCGNREPPRRFRLKPGAPPWLLNPIYVGRVARAQDPAKEPVNDGLFDDYVRLQPAGAPDAGTRGKVPSISPRPSARWPGAPASGSEGRGPKPAAGPSP